LYFYKECDGMHLSRREFVTWVGTSGIMLVMTRSPSAQAARFDETQILPGTAAPRPAHGATGRIDAVAKVTGAKLYASDFRAADMDGWPPTTAHALLIRATDATHVFEGLDLSALGAGAQPTKIVTAEDLARAGTRAPPFYAGDLLCPVGKTPLYLGQPVALLPFETFDAYDRARVRLRQTSPIKLSAATGPLAQPNYAALRFTRVAGDAPGAPDVYRRGHAGRLGLAPWRRSYAGARNATSGEGSPPGLD
jgi:hypothetical protein